MYDLSVKCQNGLKWFIAPLTSPTYRPKIDTLMVYFMKDTIAFLLSLQCFIHVFNLHWSICFGLQQHLTIAKSKKILYAPGTNSETWEGLSSYKVLENCQKYYFTMQLGIRCASLRSFISLSSQVQMAQFFSIFFTKLIWMPFIYHGKIAIEEA